MIEFQYDEKTYVKMSMRISWWLYAIIIGVVLALFAWVCSMYISDYANGEVALTYMLITLGVYLCVMAALIAVFFVVLRRQLAKSFAMYSANGVAIQRAEVTDEELIVYNVSRQNVTKTRRRDIVSVKKYKKFFVVATNMKAKWAVPFNEQTQLLYNVLTGVSSVEVLPTKNQDTESASVGEKVAEQSVDIPSQPDALHFEFELTEQQAISMLTKFISVRFRVLLVVGIFFALATVLFLLATVGSFLTVEEESITIPIFAVLFAILTVLDFVIYGSKNKSGKTNGSKYFEQQSKDGQCQMRIELYDQGIVVVNLQRETRVYFRFSDMEKVRLFADFYLVEFKSKEVLPIPLTDNTRALYDILNRGVRRK